MLQAFIYISYPKYNVQALLRGIYIGLSTRDDVGQRRERMEKRTPKKEVDGRNTRENEDELGGTERRDGRS